jgi:chromosomal replication initiator protein
MQASPLPGPPEGLTLDTFGGEGEGNSAAVTLAQQVASGADPAQNPFFVVGRKEKARHLLAGIAHAVRQSRPNARIAFLSGEEMAAELAAAIEKRFLEGWRQRYRALDLLAIVEVEPLLAAELTDPLLGLLEHLLRGSVQVAFSARTTPRRIAGLDPRLLSRLEGGLVLDLASLGPRRAGAARSTVSRSSGGAPDRWFLNREKLAWDWVALPERIMEELG